MTHQEITHDQASKLAAFVSAVRDDWDTPGIMKALETARLRVGVTPADIGIAAIKAAANPKNRTPAIIALPGDHWRERVREDTPIPDHLCRICYTPHADGDCPGSIRAGNAHRALAEIRANLIEAKRQLCPCGCGVPPANCLQHEETA